MDKNFSVNLFALNYESEKTFFILLDGYNWK